MFSDDNKIINEIITCVESLNSIKNKTLAFVFYSTNKILGNYKINKENNIDKNIVRIIVPPEIIVKSTTIDLNRLKELDYSEEIINFVNTVIKEFPRDNLNYFYNNIHTLKIKQEKLEPNVVGQYDLDRNMIVYAENPSILTIFHELLHASSSIKTEDNKRLYGFYHSYDDSYILGYGLNEGYTQLLTERYFSKYVPFFNPYDNDYYFQRSMAMAVEKLIGDKKMLGLYLRADLRGLLNEISMYADPTDVVSFMKNCDHTINDIHDLRRTFTSYPNGIKRYDEIADFLLKAYSNKLNNEVSSSIKTREEATIDFSSYFSILSFFAPFLEDELRYLNFELKDTWQEKDIKSTK